MVLSFKQEVLMSKAVFKPCKQHQMMLLPPDLSDLIPPDSLVRVVDEVIDSIDTRELYALYPGGGTSAYDPKMMLKVIVYAYASGIYSSRRIEKATRENIHFMWICGMQPLDHMTINRFRSERIRPVFENIFTNVVTLLADKGLITLDTYFLDGTKIEADANKYTFVWKKSVDANRAKLQNKVHRHLEEIDRINEEEDRLAESLPEPEEVTAEDIAEVARRINERLKARPEDKDLTRGKKSFENDYLPRMKRYEKHSELFGERASFSKTDTDATFMRMKEDHMRNGQLKAGYNVQIGSENQVIVGYTLHRRAGDTACTLPHLKHLSERLGRLPSTIVADAGYGSEENYAYLKDKGVRAFVKYNMFYKEQKRSFRRDPTQQRNWVFDKETDTWMCGGGRTLSFTYERQETSELGYKSTTRVYRCENCTDCPHHKACTKSDDASKNRTIYVGPLRDAYRTQAAELLTSAEGIDLRRRRATDVETVFGDIKQNHGFKRFTLRGLDKVTHEWGLVALGHNMRKLQAAMFGKASRTSPATV